MTGMTFEEALSDFDAALARLKNARWVEHHVQEQRRALNEVMSALYRLRNHRIAATTWQEHVAEADRSKAGRIVEAIAFVRGAGDHDFSRDVMPDADYAYPGERTFPSKNLFLDDRNLWWRGRQQLGYDLLEHASRQGAGALRRAERQASYYDDHLARFLVLDTLDTARDFFAPAT